MTDNVEYLNPGDVVLSENMYNYFQKLIKLKKGIKDKINVLRNKSKDFECCVELCDDLLEFINKLEKKEMNKK
jgi:hypothetical protein